MTPILLSGPALEPVSLVEAKNWLRLDTSDEDNLVQALITSARLVVEASVGVQLIAQSWRLAADRWPGDRCISLPLRPVLTLDAIRIFDNQGDSEVIATMDYHADLAGMNPRVQFLKAPPPPGQSLSGIQIDVTAGFGPAADDVPAALRQAILLLLARWFENRGDAAGDAHTLPDEIAALVSPWRAMRLT